MLDEYDSFGLFYTDYAEDLVLLRGPTANNTRTRKNVYRLSGSIILRVLSH